MPVIKTCPIRGSVSCRTDCAWYNEKSCQCAELDKAQSLDFLVSVLENIEGALRK